MFSPKDHILFRPFLPEGRSSLSFHEVEGEQQSRWQTLPQAHHLSQLTFEMQEALITKGTSSAHMVRANKTAVVLNRPPQSSPNLPPTDAENPLDYLTVAAFLECFQAHNFLLNTLLITEPFLDCFCMPNTQALKPSQAV